MVLNIDKFADTFQRVRWADLGRGEFVARPLPEDTLRCLRYMCDVEYHTVCYMRNMLVAASHQDKDVSPFMTMWNREDYWHGEAPAEVLGVHGIVVDCDVPKAKRVKLGWSEVLKSLKQSLVSSMVGAGFMATHMAWGAANEWSAVAAYRRLANREKHPVLAVLLERIAEQESRHVAIHAAQARRHPGSSRKAQHLTRFALRKFWAPVGSGVTDPGEVDHVMGKLFGGEDNAHELDRRDHNMARLPGMDGLRTFHDATAHARAGHRTQTAPA